MIAIAGSNYPVNHHPITVSAANNHPVTFVLLDAPETDALDEGALEEEEEGDHRQDDEGRGGHEEAELKLTLRLEEGQPKGQGVLGVVQEEDQGTDEVVPGMQSREDADDPNGGERLGKDDLGEDAEFAGAIDARGVRDV